MKLLQDESSLSEHIEALDELGFDTSLKGCEYFINASVQMQEVLQIIDSNNFDEINSTIFPKCREDELFNEYLNAVCLEAYATEFECGRKNYFDELGRFTASALNSSTEKIDKHKSVFMFDCDETPTIADYIIRGAEYFYSKKILIPESQKTYSKYNRDLHH